MQLKHYFKYIFAANYFSATPRHGSFPLVGQYVKLLKPMFLTLFLTVFVSFGAFAGIFHKTGHANKPLLAYNKEVAAAFNGPIKISGQVVDTAGAPLSGVSVTIVGTRISTISNAGGYFNIVAEIGKKLHFSSLGFESKMIPITESSKSLKVILEGTSTQLVGVTVIATGYQTLTAKDKTTGSYATVNTKKIESVLQPNIENRLEGSVTGLVKTTQYEDGKQKKFLTLRGTSTLYANKQPLYVLDGMPYEGDIENITPSEVENITVLKDASAASIYGARAANGVIVINTKKGKEGKMTLNYTNSFRITQMPNIGYLNLMNSSQLIDMEKESFIYNHTTFNPRTVYSKAEEILYKYEKDLGNLNLEKELGVLRKLDNTQQIKDLLLRKVGFSQEHDFAVSGGNDKNLYRGIFSYIDNKPFEKTENSNTIRLGLSNDMTPFKWLTANIGIYANFDNSHAQASNNDARNVYGMSMLLSGNKYNMLQDEKGKPLPSYYRDSQYEIDKIKGLGFFDGSFYPLLEKDKTTRDIKTNYYRISGGLNFKILKDILNFNVNYQTEMSKTQQTDMYNEDSWFVRTMLNEASAYSYATKKVKTYIPQGSQMLRIYSAENSYTLRSQLNYNHEFNVHKISAIAGSEIRSIASQSELLYKLGYNPRNNTSQTPELQGKLADYVTGGDWKKMGNYMFLNPDFHYKSAEGIISSNYFGGTYFNERLDRYVSLYANASYTYNNTYTLSGSIRTDQSNLYGTDKSVQYKPFYSLGLGWNATSEDFMKDINWLNRLNFRLTYGTNGNLSKDASPFLKLRSEGFDEFGQPRNQIWKQPNKNLRWELTAVTNLGIDFSVMQNRISGTIELYKKHTTDLLGDRETDPTSGFTSTPQNYGKMQNKGIEITINSINFSTRDFTWSSDIGFSFNQNKVLVIDSKRNLSPKEYAKHSFIIEEGKSMGSLYSYRWGGLDTTGLPTILDAAGKKIKGDNITKIEDLQYHGTIIPPYTATLNNFIRYKDFSLSFLLSYVGGHVFKDQVATYLYMGNSGGNKLTLNHWKNKGDEQKDPNMAPGFNKQSHLQTLWENANIHVKPADFIKLRNITLSYQLPYKRIRNLYMNALRFSFQVENVWSWFRNNSNTDPEAYMYMSGNRSGSGHRTMPIPAIYTLGLNVNF